MSQASNFFMRPYDAIKDRDAVSKIPRLPVSFDPMALEAISHPIAFDIRPSLSKRSVIACLEDTNAGRPVGAYGFNIKDMRVNGQRNTVFYMLDICIDPTYRNQSISSIFFNSALPAVREESKRFNTVMFGSTFKLKSGDSTVVRRAKGIQAVKLCEQRQSAWRVESEVAMSNLEDVTIYEEKDQSRVKSLWNSAFSKFNYTPLDFSDITDYNSKYVQTTYIAEMTVNGTLIQASISVWDQDQIFNLRDRTGDNKKHRQLFSCLCTEKSERGDELFRHLLQRVHNDMYKQNVDYLFIGYDVQDPVAKHFPLVPSLKCMDFVVHTSFFGSEKDFEKYKNDISKSEACWNDPRDYGILVLCPNESTPIPSDVKFQKAKI
eukprot:gene7632-8928_t